MTTLFYLVPAASVVALLFAWHGIRHIRIGREAMVPAGGLSAAEAGALEGVEATKGMLPRLGRSKNFREQALGWPDPGAISVSVLFRGLADGIAAA